MWRLTAAGTPTAKKDMLAALVQNSGTGHVTGGGGWRIFWLQLSLLVSWFTKCLVAA